MRVKNWRDAIADLEATNVRSERGNGANSIGQRNAAERRLPTADAVYDEQIAIVDRERLHLQTHLSWPGYRSRALDEAQRIQAITIMNFDYSQAMKPPGVQGQEGMDSSLVVRRRLSTAKSINIRDNYGCNLSVGLFGDTSDVRSSNQVGQR